MQQGSHSGVTEHITHFETDLLLCGVTKAGEPLTSQLQEVDIKGDPDDQYTEALISHRG